jgi:DNA-binding winged helix-turn-helix (wHTH) protein/tetratricopeptide (TPR) repeat protein
MDAPTLERSAYAFGAFHLDAARRTLTRDGVPVALTPTVFDLLHHLVANAGRIVGKEELIETVWAGRFLDESNLTTTISVLRKALKESGETGRLIVTAPGRGYMFTGEVRRGDASPETPASPAVAEPARRAGQRRLPLILAGAGVFALAAGILTFVFLHRDGDRRHTEGNPLVVVAPFENLTGEPVFDRTLATAETIDLDQSPYLDVLTDQRVQDTLALMALPRDQSLTPAVAGEVCVRNNGAAVLDGSISAIGTRYLVTLRATDCSGARLLAAAKALAYSREAVIPAVDHLTAVLRGRLGESLPSIERFRAPLLPEKTASLDALRAYSQATWLNDHGQRAESIPLFQRAIALDPNFAAAYASLSFIYYRMNWGALDAANIANAYALRSSLGERERLHIVARYDQSVTKDLDAAVRDLLVWTAAYPRDPTPWTLLAATDTELGRSSDAVAAGKRAVSLDPGKEDAYDILARAYLHADDLAGVSRTCALAAARGLQGDQTHLLVLRVALARDDRESVDRELAWVKGRRVEAAALIELFYDAIARGEVRRAEAFYMRGAALGRGDPAMEVDTAALAIWLADMGFTDRASKWLSGLGADPHSRDLVAEAEVGDDRLALAILQRLLRNAPSDTILKGLIKPRVLAAVDLRHGRPGEAVVALRPAASFDRRGSGGPYIRGVAYLAARDGPNAVEAFEQIVGKDMAARFEPVNPDYALATLGLARAYRMEGNIAVSRRYYEAFLADWMDADGDIPVLAQAKAEFAALPGASGRHDAIHPTPADAKLARG